jgi:hypothetical protein
VRDGDKIRVKLPDGYEMFQDGDEVRTDPNVKSARLRDYILKFEDRPVARLHDYVHESPRGVKGNVAFGGFTRSVKTDYRLTDDQIPFEVRRRLPSARAEGLGNAARAAAETHRRSLRPDQR